MNAQTPERLPRLPDPPRVDPAQIAADLRRGGYLPDNPPPGRPVVDTPDLTHHTDPHQAEILVEWWPSASIGELEAVRHLLEGWCGQLMERLQALGVTDPTVELDIAASQPPPAGAIHTPEAPE